MNLEGSSLFFKPVSGGEWQELGIIDAFFEAKKEEEQWGTEPYFKAEDLQKEHSFSTTFTIDRYRRRTLRAIGLKDRLGLYTRSERRRRKRLKMKRRMRKKHR